MHCYLSENKNSDYRTDGKPNNNSVCCAMLHILAVAVCTKQKKIATEQSRCRKWK